MASYFPKALLYREWREGRLMYLLAGLATFLNSLIDISGYWSIPNHSPYRQQLLNNFWQTFYSDTTKFTGHSMPPLFFILVWIAIPVLRLVPERSRGSLAMMLSSPVKRVDWLRVKFWLGFAILTIASTIDFVLMWLLHFQAPSSMWTTTEEIFRQVGIHWVVYVAFYAMSFFLSLCVTNTIGAVLICLGVSMAPFWLSTVLPEIFPISTAQIVSGLPIQTMDVPRGTFIYLIQWLSPMTMETIQIGFTWLNVWLYWYLVLAVIAYFGAMWYFRQMRAEKFQLLLTRSSLWYWMLTGFSLVVGSGIAGTVTSARTQNMTDYDPEVHARIFTVSFLAFSAGIWLVVWAFFLTREKRRERRELHAVRES